MPARRAALLGLLLAACGALAWNRVRVQEPVVAPAPPAAHAPRLEDLSPAAQPGRVADAALVLGDFRSTLQGQTDAWLRDLGVDVQIATLALADVPIAQLAPRVFALRHIGESAPTGGILILLDPARQEARIEVSYALEGALPDAFVGRIAADQLAPYVSYHTAGMAVMDVVHELKDFVYLRAIQGGLALGQAYRERPEFREKERFLSGGAGAEVALSDIPVDRDFKARVPDARRARYAPSSDPLESVEAFLRVGRDMAGDPSLELFTPGSQCMSRGYPFAPFEQLERLRIMQASKPFTAIVRGDRAVVTSKRPAHAFVPILLHRIEGTWRVDLVETWKNLFFDGNGDYNLVNSNNPYAFGLAAYGNAPAYDVAALDLAGAPLAEVMEHLGQQKSAMAEYWLAELQFRNCFLSVDAFNHYEEALKRAPHDPLFQQVLGDRARYVGFYDLAVSAYSKLGPEGYIPIALTYREQGDYKRAAAWVRRAVQRNPYDTAALRLLRDVLGQAHDAGSREVDAQLAALGRDPTHKDLPLEVSFDPARPALHIDDTTQVGKTAVYDYSFFSVTLANPSARPVQITKVVLASAGTGSRSGLGDIKRYWSYPSGAPRLAPGESVRLDRTWGFTVDTPHEQLSYIFDVCWKGDGDVEQCGSHRLDLFAL
jgi:TPM domain